MKKIISLLIFSIVLIIFIYVGRIKLAAFYNNKGINYYDRGSYKQAISLLKKSIQIHPQTATAHYNLANAYAATGLQKEAIEEYKKTLQLDPAYTSAYRALANIYLVRQMYPEAISLIKRLEAYSPVDEITKNMGKTASFEYMADCLSRGVDAFLANDKKTAYELLNSALKIKPDFAYTNYTLGYFYYVDRKYEEAESYLKQTIRIDPGFWLAYKVLGDIWLKRGDHEKSIDMYKKAISLNRSEPILYNDLGLILMQVERYGEAVEYLKEALRLYPDDIDIRFNLATVYRDNGMINEALAQYKEVVYRQPDYPNVHNEIGDIYTAQGKDEEASGEFRSEINYSQHKLSLNQNDAITLTNLAHAYNSLKEYDKAEEAVKKAIALEPGYQAAYLTLAVIRERLRDYEGALVWLNKARSLSGSKKPNYIDRDIIRIEKISNLVSGRPVRLDSVYLKNGRLLKGIIKEEQGNDIILEVYAGQSVGVVTLSRDSIERIVKYSDASGQ